MSNNNTFSIIDLDDDDSQPVQASLKDKPIPSGPGISSFVFPKLHQMLQRRKGKPEEENKIVEIVPEVMKEPNDENEVCKVVSIVPLQRQTGQFQVTVQIDKPKILFDEKNDINVPSDVGETNLLVVEQVYQPLVLIESGHFQTLPVTIPNTKQDNIQMEVEEAEHENNQYQQKEALIEPPPLEVCEDIPIVNEPIHQSQLIQQYVHELPCQNSVEQVQLLHEQPAIDQLIHEQPVIEQEVQIISSSQAPIAQIPAITVATESKTNQANKQELTSQQIRKLLKNLLPDMDSAIQNMNDQELADIYRSVKSEVEQNQLQDLIEGISPQPQPQPTFNAIIEVEKQPSPPSLEQIQQRKPTQPEKEQTSIKTLKHFKTLPYEEMKAAMKRHFPFDSDQYDLMDYEELIEILNQCIVQIENSSKDDEMQQLQPIQSPVLRVIQPQEKPATPHQQKPVESISIDDEANKISEMKHFLVESIPSIRPQQLQNVNSEYIKMLYDGAINGRLSRAQIGQKIESYSNSILERCLQKFPHLKASLNKISEEEIYTLINSLSNGRQASNETVNVRPSEIKESIVATQDINISKETQKNTARQQQVIQVEAPQKRTHDMLLATNPRRLDEGKSNYKRRNPGELRQKLLNRLPELKQKIMMLDDSEIEKIYRDSIERNRQTNSGRHNEPEARPVIVMKQKKQMQSFNKPEANREDLKNIADQLSANGLYKGKILQINGEQKKKKSRTIIFVHTEEDSQDDEGRNMKIKRTENGVQRKSGCDCLQKATVGALLKRLTQLVDNKN